MMVGGRNPFKQYGRDPNCHYLGEDQPLWTLPSSPRVLNNSAKNAYFPEWARGYRIHQSNCSTLEDVLQEKGIDFEGNENFLPYNGKDAHVSLCPRFRNVILL